MTCSDLHAQLSKMFCAPGYLYMAEVRNATGFDATRSADAMALGMYQSKGRILWGFEMKVSRSDWKKELEQADKAESWMRYCDRWALVVSDAAIVHPGELPPTWGLYAPVKGKLKCITPAPALQPEPLTRVALTALMYAASKADEDAIQKRIQEALANVRQMTHDSNERDARKYKELQHKVDEFERHSGIHVQWADDERLKGMGAAVDLIMSGDKAIQRKIETLKYAVLSVEEMVPAMRAQIETLTKNVLPGVDLE